MSPKTVLIVVIGAVVIGGGILLWVLFSAPAAQTPGAGTTQTGSYGGSNQTSVSNNQYPVGTTPTQTQTVPDLKQAYDELLQRILGEKVVFAQTDTASGEAGSVYALYADDVAAAKKAYPQVSRFPISIALVDVTDDGIAEALVEEDLPGYCGSGGCPFDIYKKVKGAWVPVFNGLAAGDISLANNLTKGYRDLYLSVPGDVGFQTRVVRYTWDGTQYVPGEIMAVWDGSSFQVVQ